MKTNIFFLGCLLGIAWSVANAQEIKSSAVAVCEKHDECITQKKHDKDTIDDFDIEALIEKYNKYEAIMSQLGLAHHSQRPSGLTKFLKYMAIPVGAACWWYAMGGLIFSDRDKVYGWPEAFAIGTLAYLASLYAVDFFEGAQEASRAKTVLPKLVKMYEEHNDTFPKDLEPVAKLLQQHVCHNGAIDLDDGLLISLVEEIVREHKVTRDEVRKCIAQVNAEVFE